MKKIKCDNCKIVFPWSNRLLCNACDKCVCEECASPYKDGFCNQCDSEADYNDDFYEERKQAEWRYIDDKKTSK